MVSPTAPAAEPAEAEIPAFPVPRTCPFAPPERYAELRAEEPVSRVLAPTGQTAWLVTRYADVRRLLIDSRISSDRFHPNMPLTEEVTEQTRRNIAEGGRSLIGLDEPEHGPRRKMLITEFTVRRMHELRPHIQHTVDACIDDLLAGPNPADLVPALCLRVPSTTLCALLGMPYEDHGLIERTAVAQLRRTVTAAERQEVSSELRDYVDALVRAKEAEPTDDLLGRLILRNREEKLFDHKLLVGLVMLLLVAGHETTASMIALGVTALLQHPDQIPLVTGEPEVCEAAVEELLRYFTVVDALPRVAKGDVEVGGVTVKDGDGLLLSFAAADWDESVFPRDQGLDLSRGARHHLAFGFGIHQCIGQNMAREELQAVYRTLFTRIPTLRLAEDFDRLPFKQDSNIYGVDRVPVTW